MKQALLIVIAFAFSYPVFAENVKKSFKAKGLDELEVSNTMGKVKVLGKKNAKEAVVNVEKVRFGKRCSLSIEEKGDKLEVIVTKKAMLGFSEPCEANILVEVPETFDVDATVGSGDIYIKDVQGEIDFNSGSGKVLVENSGEEIDGKTGSGDIKVDATVAGDYDLRTGSGDIMVKVKKIPAEGDIEIKTGSGDALVEVPAGSKIDTEMKTGSGNIQNEVGTDKNSEFTISTRTGSGDVKIKKL